MSSIIFSILSIYVFIVMDFLAKMSFKDKIDERTITLLNVHFLQVFLTFFWGAFTASCKYYAALYTRYIPLYSYGHL